MFPLRTCGSNHSRDAAATHSETLAPQVNREQKKPLIAGEERYPLVIITAVACQDFSGLGAAVVVVDRAFGHLGSDWVAVVRLSGSIGSRLKKAVHTMQASYFFRILGCSMNSMRTDLRNEFCPGGGMTSCKRKAFEND